MLITLIFIGKMTISIKDCTSPTYHDKICSLKSIVALDKTEVKDSSAFIKFRFPFKRNIMKAKIYSILRKCLLSFSQIFILENIQFLL